MSSFQPIRSHIGTKPTSSTVYASGKMKLVTFYLPKEVRTQLKDAARTQKVSCAMIFREALELWFEKVAMQVAPTRRAAKQAAQK